MQLSIIAFLMFFFEMYRVYVCCSAIIEWHFKRQTGHGPARQSSRPCPWPQVPSWLHKSNRKEHPRFFVREIHKG